MVVKYVLKYQATEPENAKAMAGTDVVKVVTEVEIEETTDAKTTMVTTEAVSVIFPENAEKTAASNVEGFNYIVLFGRKV